SLPSRTHSQIQSTIQNRRTAWSRCTLRGSTHTLKVTLTCKVQAMPILTAEELTNLARNILEAAGATKEDAQTVTDSLVRANLAGVDSHGVLRLTSYVQGLRNGVIKSGAKNEIV